MFHFIIPLFFSYQKKVLIFLYCIVASSISYACNKKVAVIVPLEHEAMIQIVSGITESLSNDHVDVIVKNAHGDLNIALALMRQIQEQDVDLIMSIGNILSQMVIAHITTKPIVCVAASIDNSKHHMVAVINDEISIIESLDKLPFLHKVTLIYSASEKVIPEVELFKLYAAQHNLSVHLAMIHSLNDLRLVAASAPDDTKAFIILKDHLVVSGINILMQEVFKRSIPLIASDEGSVIQGATIAIGVREKDIGRKSALIAQAILKGSKPSNIPIVYMKDLVLFVNSYSFDKQNIISQSHLSSLPFLQVKVNNE